MYIQKNLKNVRIKLEASVCISYLLRINSHDVMNKIEIIFTSASFETLKVTVTNRNQMREVDFNQPQYRAWSDYMDLQAGLALY